MTSMMVVGSMSATVLIFRNAYVWFLIEPSSCSNLVGQRGGFVGRFCWAQVLGTVAPLRSLACLILWRAAATLQQLVTTAARNSEGHNDGLSRGGLPTTDLISEDGLKVTS